MCGGESWSYSELNRNWYTFLVDPDANKTEIKIAIQQIFNVRVLTVIAAVLLGGTSFLGGAGSMVGTLIGVLFIAVLQNGLNLLGVQALWQGVVTGVVLILAVWADRVRRPA